MTAIWPFLPAKRPLSLSHSKGAYLYMKDGSKILDAAGGAIVINVGHGRKDVADAIARGAINTTYAVPPWLTPEREALVMELKNHWLPAHLSRVHLASGGSEANESAMKIAIQYQAARGKPEKHIILARDISYHGTTISTAAVSGHPGRKKGLETILEDYPRISTPYPLRCPLGRHHPDAADYYIKELEEVIERLGSENIAALIAEPLNGSSGGAITPPDNYWNRAQKILKEKDILLIMDEVMTGFGRTGKKFGSELYAIQPDLLVAGKGMAGGYAAIAGTYGTEEIASTIAAAGYDIMFHTFGALPLSCTAATKVLQILREENMLEEVVAKGNMLREKLHEEFGQHPLVAEIRGEGLLTGIEVVRNRDTLERFEIEEGITNKLVGYGMEAGVFFYPGGNGEVRDIVCLGPPFIIDEADMDLMVSALKHALEKVAVNS